MINNQQCSIVELNLNDHEMLLGIWSRSVKAIHHFLAEQCYRFLHAKMLYHSKKKMP